MKLGAYLYFARSLILPRAERKSSARRSFFGAFICIGLSVIPLVTVISVTNGMINAMTERLIELSSGHLEMRVANGIEQTKSAGEFTAYARGFEAIDGVEKAFPELTVSALAVSGSVRTGAFIRGVSPGIFSENPSFKSLFEVMGGSTSSLCEESKIPFAVIGQRMAETLEVGPGDSFRIITTRKSGGRVAPKITSFRVGAVVSSGYQELDEIWIFIPMEAFFRSFSLENASFSIMLRTSDAFSPVLGRIQRDVKKAAGRYANVYRWDQVNASHFENFSSTKVMLVFIMMMIVLVASINISSAIVMLVMERRREIAILKSFGATPRGITLSFMLTGLSCGVFGLCFALPCGILITVFSNQIIRGLERLVNALTKAFYLASGSPVSQIREIKLMDPQYYLQTIPVEIPAGQIMLVAAGTLLLSLLVSALPAVRAGREKPLEALRS